MFRIGQKVVCVKDGRWRDAKNGRFDSGPRYNEVCTISGVDLDGYLQLEEYPKNEYHKPCYFRPLDDDWVQEVLKNVFAEVKENELVEV